MKHFIKVPSRSRKSLHNKLGAVILLGALAFSGVLLAGCSTSSSDQQILDKLNQMESEITALQGAQSGTDQPQSTDSQTQSTDSGQATTNSNQSTTQNSAVSNTDLDAAITDFEGRATAAAQTADAVEVPASIDQRPQAYYDAKAPLETLEHEADQLDDQIEVAFRQGTIDRNTMWSLDQRLDVADDSLDAASDRLEMRMGVDD